MPTQTRQALVFIDATLPDLATLRAGLPPDAEVHLLDPCRDGLRQIAAVLQDQHDLAALHLICHGAPGKLYLGNANVDQNDLPYYANELNTISNAMTADG